MFPPTGYDIHISLYFSSFDCIHYLILDGMLAAVTNLKILDFSHNSIMKVEDNALVGINVSYLDLGYNSLRRIPSMSLRRLSAATTIVLDGNLLTVLEKGCVYNIRVKFLTLSHNQQLTRLEQSSVDNLSQLETLTINNNPSLSYFHPGALANVPKLVVLDLSRNSLFSMEDIRKYLPNINSLYLHGNKFRYNCSTPCL